MKIFNNKKDLKDCLLEYKRSKKTIGFVPTMGALHRGHLSLIEEAQRTNNIVVASIFVNPTQFDNVEDLKKYPKTIENDIKLLAAVSCDVLFSPPVEEIYSENVVSEKLDFDGLEHEMEGKFRDGHFDGVGTVVKTLFKIIEPNSAYFGQKDFQQLQIIKKMVQKNKLNINVKGCQIFREKDGLAMSSRNSRLSNKSREVAPFIYEILEKVKDKLKTKSVAEINDWVENEFKTQKLLKLEYFIIADEKTLKTTKKRDTGKKYRAFIAVFAGKIRLIDNIRLE